MDRDAFIANVSRALGRNNVPTSAEASPSRFADPESAVAEADIVRRDVVDRRHVLTDDAVASLKQGNWKVHRAGTVEDVGEIVTRICQAIGAKSAMLSGHEILQESQLATALTRDGMDVSEMVLPDDLDDATRAQIRSEFRDEAFSIDVGITGGDYVIVETGTLVLHPKKGVSRLISLVPPVHVAVMRSEQILPSLDELFLLEQVDIDNGLRHGSMNLVSGPSRTGDIEAEIVQGIHGPLETHIVLVG